MGQQEHLTDTENFSEDLGRDDKSSLLQLLQDTFSFFKSTKGVF